MAQGDYLKALKMVARVRGWDPDKLIDNDTIGLPVDIERRAGAWDPNAQPDTPDRTLSFEAMDWAGKETPISGRATKNANPYAGKAFSTPSSARPAGPQDDGGVYGQGGEGAETMGMPGMDGVNQEG